MTKATLKFRDWRFLLGLVISVVALFFVFYKVKWQEFLEQIQSVKLGWIFIGAVIFTASLGIRAILWKTLLTRVAEREARYSDCFAYFMIGYAANNVLPLRLGEIVRAYYISREEKLRFSKVIAVTAVERLFDLLGLMCFVVVLTAFTSILVDIPPFIRTGMVVVEIAAVVILMAFVVLAFFETEFISLRRVLSRILPARLIDKGFGVIVLFAVGLRSLFSVKAISTVLILSLLAWCLVILDAYMYIHAFSFELDQPLLAAMLLVTVANLGAIVPSSPGALGVAHSMFTISLLACGVALEPAVAFAVVRHGVLYSLTTLIGLSCIWPRHFSLRELAAESQRAVEDMPRGA